MTLTWIFALCFLNSQGECVRYVPQTNYAYMSLDNARRECANRLKDMGPAAPGSDTKYVCLKGYQYDVTYGRGM